MVGRTDCRGLDKAHFRQFLQCWALLQMEPLYKVAQTVEAALTKPTSDVIRSQQVSMQSRSREYHGSCGADPCKQAAVCTHS